ncbi:NADPH:quinone oxidoreductase family protein [Oceanobacillus senegalensis]|uniref:NADPH:quinone oxidoreductase family protein n=1 Tax=Oceanobacillus senegalensis TaxID=1936063 RepID=UPI000A30FB2E|nr:NADPH:quinone oxidoreductase family protein [Oceanobacillus senegalensis]
MQAWEITKLGEPREALKVQNLSQKEILEKHVRIKVDAFSMNFFDILQCRGEYQEKPELPFTPGAEVSGVITEVGWNANFRKGQRVLATPLLPNGGYAEEVVVDEKNVYRIPETMSSDDAAAIYITYQSALYGLKYRGTIQSGETVLVHAASGGIGSAAVQLAKAFGATVIATAGSKDKLQKCTEIGADFTINYREEDFVPIVKEITNGKGADIIFDPVGGDTFQKSRKCIAFDGRLLVIGFAGGKIPEAPANHVLIKNYSIVGVHFGYFKSLFPEKVQELHEELMDLYVQGNVKPLIYKKYRFEEVIEGLEALESRLTYGKLIVQL